MLVNSAYAPCNKPLMILSDRYEVLWFFCDKFRAKFRSSANKHNNKSRGGQKFDAESDVINKWKNLGRTRGRMTSQKQSLFSKHSWFLTCSFNGGKVKKEEYNLSFKITQGFPKKFVKIKVEAWSVYCHCKLVSLGAVQTLRF